MIARRPQRGVALLALVTLIALAASWLLVRQLNAEAGGIDAVRKQRNAEVLQRAKQALIGYVAMQASKQFENDPGRLPCPEAAGSYGNAATEGTAAGFCTLPAVGRFPWRTIGTERLEDASGEPLWYVVATGWSKTSATVNTVINSNCASVDSGMACAPSTVATTHLNVDGTANAAVALLIAPGPAFNVPAATGCAAWPQSRPVAGTLDLRNYLECSNATSPADSAFVTSGPSSSFNDQVMKVTVAELMPGIEGGVAARIASEIVPVLKTVYEAPSWGLQSFGTPAVADRVYPFPAAFGNPNTVSFAGTTATLQGPSPAPYAGLLPAAYAETYPGSGVACVFNAVTAPRCNPALRGWTNWAASTPTITIAGAGVTLTSACSYLGQTSWAYCNGTYTGTPTNLTISGLQTGTTALRSLTSPLPTGFVFWWDMTTWGFTLLTPTPTLELQADGSLRAVLSVTPPAPAGPAGVQYWLYIPGNLTRDHSLLDARSSSATPTPPTTSWFMRNEWHKLLYYAVAPGYAASTAAPRTCTTGTPGTCLLISNLPLPSEVTPTQGAQRAILILAGRSINGSARPSATLSDYFEFGNATAAFERQPISTVVNAASKRPFNDRIVVLDSN